MRSPARSPHPGRPDEHAAPPRRSPRTGRPESPSTSAPTAETASDQPRASTRAPSDVPRRPATTIRLPPTRPARSPPAGRVTMPTKRISPPASPAAVELAPSRSRSGTTQFPATTASPNVAACRRPIGSNRRSRTTHWPAWPDARKANGGDGGDEREKRQESSAPVRRTPARGVGQRRHDHECEPSPDHGRAAVEPLQRSTSSSCADEIEPGHEPRSGTEADDRASEERQPEAGVDEEDQRCRRLPPRSREARCAASRSDPRRAQMGAGPRGA